MDLAVLPGLDTTAAQELHLRIDMDLGDQGAREVLVVQGDPEDLGDLHLTADTGPAIVEALANILHPLTATRHLEVRSGCDDFCLNTAL